MNTFSALHAPDSPLVRYLPPSHPGTPPVPEGLTQTSCRQLMQLLTCHLEPTLRDTFKVHQTNHTGSKKQWLIDWLIDWLIGWLIYWLIDWLIVCVCQKLQFISRTSFLTTMSVSSQHLWASLRIFGPTMTISCPQPDTFPASLWAYKPRSDLPCSAAAATSVKNQPVSSSRIMKLMMFYNFSWGFPDRDFPRISKSIY